MKSFVATVLLVTIAVVAAEPPSSRSRFAGRQGVQQKPEDVETDADPYVYNKPQGAAFALPARIQHQFLVPVQQYSPPAPAEEDDEPEVPARIQQQRLPGVRQQYPEFDQDNSNVQGVRQRIIAPQKQNNPQEQFATPQKQYNPQQQQFAPQQFAPQQFAPQQYYVPQQQYVAPEQQYFAPQRQYLSPQQQYGAPQRAYGAPAQINAQPPRTYQQPKAETTTEVTTEYTTEEDTTETTTEAEVFNSVKKNNQEKSQKQTAEGSERDAESINPEGSDAQEGLYYLLLPNGQLQKVVYMTSADLANMAYTARLQYSNVDPIRGPVYAYNPENSPLIQLQFKK